MDQEIENQNRPADSPEESPGDENSANGNEELLTQEEVDAMAQSQQQETPTKSSLADKFQFAAFLSLIQEALARVKSIQLPKASDIKALENLKSISPFAWFKITGILALTSLMIFILSHWGGQWIRYFKGGYMNSWADYAQGEYVDLSQNVQYETELLSPQYIVLIKKIVVNLKRSKSSSATPMVAFEIYAKADTQEAAVEIKEREKELQDFIQRVSESFSYNEILSEKGKKLWKELMKKELNMVLNEGRVTEIYFKTLLIKP